MKEIWRPVKGYEGRYEVSNLGRVRSLNYRMKPGRVQVLKPAKNSDGYLNVHLYAGDGGKSIKVHRIVAAAFIPNPDNLPEINHKNEKKDDNRVENLEWCSRDENMRYGTISERIIKKQSRSVVALDPVTHRVVYRFGSAEMTRSFGFTPSEVSRCCRKARGRKTHKGLLWAYAYPEGAQGGDVE